MAIVVDALSFVVSALFVGRIRKREPKPERAPDAHLGREIAEGLRFVLGNRLLRSIAMCTGTYNLFCAVGFAMLLVLLADELDVSAGTIGLVFSVGSIGGLVGAFTATRIAKWLGQGPTIWMSTGLPAPFGLLVPIVQPGWMLWLAAFGFGVTQFGSVVYNIAQVSFRQGLTPERLLGRMNATMRFLVWGTMPIGGADRRCARPAARRARGGVDRNGRLLSRRRCRCSSRRCGRCANCRNTTRPAPRLRCISSGGPSPVR